MSSHRASFPGAGTQSPLKVAYFINQYPKVSHSFIRREILNLEDCGVEVMRVALRSCSSELVDEADQAELKKTRLVLDEGLSGLALNFLRTLVRRPIRFLKALRLITKLSRKSKWGIGKHLIYLAEACILLRWFVEAKIQHVHVHFGTNSTTVALLCRQLGGPAYSFTVHGPEEFDLVSTISLTEKINQAAFVVAISSFGKSQLYRWCKLEHWSKIHVIHCGVDEDFFRQPVTPVPESPHLVCVGRLCEQKGQLLLLEAAAQLLAEGLAFKLILVGDGPLRAEVEALVHQKGLQNHVEITGWASNVEVRRHLLTSRAMVLPSFAEGLPVVIMEALALNRPVITTYVAGIPELVEPGTCGWLVPAGSVDALTAAMRSALQSPVETLEKMGRLGSKRVFIQHNAAVEASKLAALFRATIENQG